MSSEEDYYSYDKDSLDGIENEDSDSICLSSKLPSSSKVNSFHFSFSLIFGVF